MAKKSRTTLRDIAKAANVSVAAVSYTLNGRPGRVSEAKRIEIQRLLEASGLKAQRIRKPALYLCNEKSFGTVSSFKPFFEKYRGLNREFHEHDISLRLEFLDTSGDRPVRPQLQELALHKPGAVVLDSNLYECRTGLDEAADFFQKEGVQLIEIGHTAVLPGVPAVILDDFGGAYKGTKHLIDQGHTKVATIRWKTKDDPASNLKHAAYRLALQEAGLPIVPEYIVESPGKREERNLPGRVAVEQLLALPDPPTAVFVENTFVSAPLIYPINVHETELPPAIAALDMVHFEALDLEFVEQVMAGMFCYPARKTKFLRVNWEQIGRVAAKCVADAMLGKPFSSETIRLAPTLVEVHEESFTPL